MNKKSDNHRQKILSKTQEVRYQREFKRADRVYNQLSQRRNRH
ncbi:YfhE family protein [Virgibacillus ihumii]|nr:YfhE family protein [Virgibacillus ihumii]